ncbi:cell wall hydrolase [Pyruvatibacter mobilis]|uniref:cell wall hydrolase n=1 Tax=Pyruvatibacter mobilis TaxID=1712261 RepID=UPI003BACC92F
MAKRAIIALGALALLGGGYWMIRRGMPQPVSGAPAGAPAPSPVASVDALLDAIEQRWINPFPTSFAGGSVPVYTPPVVDVGPILPPGLPELPVDPPKADSTPDPLASYRTRTYDTDIMARTLWGEARGEGRRSREMVANVIMNRVKDRRWPTSPAGVCLQPWQFSMWNAGDPNRAKAEAVDIDNSTFRQCIDIARAAQAGDLPDYTGGANHYATHATEKDWMLAMQRTVKGTAHTFYKG